MATAQWHYPGSRWWTFDFHTHTPVSRDTPWFTQVPNLTPEDWLLRFMAAGIDCVAITDHNSGAWIDKLKAAYDRLKGQGAAGFRELTLFPGMEISTQGGVHVLAVFGPEATAADVEALRGRVDYQGTPGDSDGVTTKGIAEVIRAIQAVGAVAIPAHADQDKGLLQCKPASVQAELDANTIRQTIAVDGLLAVEWCDPGRQWPECVAQEKRRFARVLGSDCHSFQGAAVPGSRYTWVKMASPTLEGLRLALLDGNGVSIRRSDDGPFDPFRIPAHIIYSIEIENARYMGNGGSVRLSCSPYFNALVGGRGTGKSTVVHALRLAARRDSELDQLGPKNETQERFKEFCRVARGRDDKGALREGTEIRVIWKSEDNLLALQWRADRQGVAVYELKDQQWQASPSQSLNAARFPLRIFSQGQIAAMAGAGRQALLAIVDEAADIGPLKQLMDDARRTFLVQRARLRELDGKLTGQPEIERILGETTRKLTALTQADYAAVLYTYAQAQYQNREVNRLFEQLRESVARIADLPNHLVLDDWSSRHFTEQDADLLAWRGEIDVQVAVVRNGILEQAQRLNALIDSFLADPRYALWHARTQSAQRAHAELQAQLAAQGVSDPQAFARLTQERQELEAQHKALLQMQTDRQILLAQIEMQRALLTERRQAITQARQQFIGSALDGNPHVRIEVVSFGFEPKQMESELRELIDVLDERFADDILLVDNGVAVGGMAFDLAQAGEAGKMAALDSVKERLLTMDGALGGHLRNYLQRKHEKPEFADRVLSWFPEDDLRIEYRRNNGWASISQGSQGQRSAALLAFLLAFGEEPMVLDQPEDDLDNYLIYDLIVRQIRENKLRRQFIIVTHNPNVVVNGDAELVHVMEFGSGQCFVKQSGALQEATVRREVCHVMEGGHEAFARRWKRLGTEI